MPTRHDTTRARILPRYDDEGRALRPVVSPTDPPPDNGAGVHVERAGTGWCVRRTDGRELGRYATRSEAVAAGMRAAGWARPAERHALVLDVPHNPRERAALLREALEDVGVRLAAAAEGEADVRACELLRLYAAELGGLAAALEASA